MPHVTRAVLHGGDPGGCVVAQVRAVRAAEGCRRGTALVDDAGSHVREQGSPSGRAPEAKAPPGHATLTGCSPSQGCPRRPGPPPARTPTAHQRGTPQPHAVPPLCDQPVGHVLAQSPARTTPIDSGHARSRCEKSSARRRSARPPARRGRPGPAAAGPPRSRPGCVEPWVARPSIEIRKVSEPPLAGTTAPSVGSAMTQADARCPRRRVAKAPSPPSSSALTACTASGRARLPRCGDGADCPEHRGEPTLHVAGAAAIGGAVLDPELVRTRGGPLRRGPREARRPCARTGPAHDHLPPRPRGGGAAQHTHAAAGLVALDLHAREAVGALLGGDVDGPLVHGQPSSRSRRAHHCWRPPRQACRRLMPTSSRRSRGCLARRWPAGPAPRDR